MVLFSFCFTLKVSNVVVLVLIGPVLLGMRSFLYTRVMCFSG